MGISAIFKRSRTATSTPDAMPDVADPARPARHIKRRPTSSAPRPSEKGNSRPDRSSKRQQPDPISNLQTPASRSARKTPATARSPAKKGELPTPTDSGDDRPLAYSAVAGVGARKSNSTAPTASRQSKLVTKHGRTPDTQRPQPDSAVFGLPRLTTPPLDKHSPELRELDPFGRYSA
ncbi:hypothetical protein LPJ59_004024 [Coemansia sp. RSA 2399]|nr:hypothetical protein LPJ59_004024 [Coemansia sp. RSA 2399]